jgi:signal transduction histidine kinase
MAKKMCLSRRAERLFVQIPICIAVVLGLSLMLTRFILVLKESLLESPADWKSFLFLAFLVGSLSLIIILACAGVGAAIGFLLRALFAQRLGTPLNAIINYSEILREEAEEQQQARSAADLARITDAGRQLLTLVNQVLDLSKIESGNIALHWSEGSPAQIVSEAVKTIEALPIRNGNRLIVRCEPALPRIRMDVEKFRRVVYNLLSNACKFTEKGTVTVELASVMTSGRRFIECRVSDTGIGISPDRIPQLFQAFSQVDQSPARRYAGTATSVIWWSPIRR